MPMNLKSLEVETDAKPLQQAGLLGREVALT